jgi:hypothetical protein
MEEVEDSGRLEDKDFRAMAFFDSGRCGWGVRYAYGARCNRPDNEGTSRRHDYRT